MSRKSYWRFVLGVVAIAALASADVQAQGRGGGGRGGPGGRRGGGGMRMNSLTLLSLDQVKEEIELSEDQVEDIKKAAEEQSAQRGGDRRGGGAQRGGDRRGGDQRGGDRRRDMSAEEREAAEAEREKQREEQAAKEKEILTEILLPHQMERLDEIAIQLRGSRALTDKTVAEKIGLSEDDVKKIEEALADGQNAMREKLFAGGRPSGDDFMAKIQEARKELDEQVVDTLTDEQKSKFDELKGEPFELSLEDLMRSRFGRGGPGGGRGGPGGARRGRGGNDDGGGGRRRRPQRPSDDDDGDSES